MSYNDKKTGHKIVRPICRHGIEIGAKQVSVMEWLPDGTKVGDIKATYAKGQKIAFALTGLERTGDTYSASGEFFPLEG